MLSKRVHVGMWTARCPPREGELLSSWIAHLAAVHGLSFNWFCRRTWPGRTIWHSDLDLKADDEIFRVVSDKTGVGRSTVEATSLARLQGWLFPSVRQARFTDWVLPAMMSQLVAFLRGSTPPGTYVRQFCSQCLASDDFPYFRLHWRLAFVTMCERHGSDLNDRCPDCGGPVAPIVADRLRDTDLREEHQALCFQCKGDLRRASADTAGADPRDLAVQRTLTNALTSRWIEIVPGHRILSALFFPVLRQIVNVVSCGQRGAEVRSVIRDKCGLEGFEPSGGREPIFEHLSRTDRRTVLRMTTWLLEQWPARFIDTCAAFKRFPISRSQFPGTPLWFQEVLDEVALPARHYQSKVEIQWLHERSGTDRAISPQPDSRPQKEGQAVSIV